MDSGRCHEGIDRYLLPYRRRGCEEELYGLRAAAGDLTYFSIAGFAGKKKVNIKIAIEEVIKYWIKERNKTGI